MSSNTNYDALRRGLAVVAREDRGVVRLRGADRLSWLQGLLTNDVLGLSPGQRVYAAYLTAQGRMITDAWVVGLPDAVLLDVPAPLAADLAARLDGLIFAEDVLVTDLSASWPVVELIGVGAEPSVSSDGALVPSEVYGRPAIVIYGETANLIEADLRDELAAATRVALSDLEVLRVEAGVPRFLVDMTDQTIPLEAGIEDRAISFSKGCYVGQELIVRVTQRGGGRVARRLVGLVLDEVPGDEAGEPVLAAGPPPFAHPEAENPELLARFGPAVPPGHPSFPLAPLGLPVHVEARAIGQVTSLVWSPTLDRAIALAYLHRDFVEVGTMVAVDLPIGRVAARVAALPFVPGLEPA